MGSAYTTMAADAITRFQRLRGKRVSFVTGTDEHGEKIAEAAAKKGQEPQQHCDGVVASFKGLWEEVCVTFLDASRLPAWFAYTSYICAKMHCWSNKLPAQAVLGFCADGHSV